MKKRRVIILWIVVLLIILLILIFFVKLLGSNKDGKNSIENNIINQKENEDEDASNSNTITEANKNEFNEDGKIEEDGEMEEVVYYDTPQKVTNKTYFYTVKNCVKNYLIDIQSLKDEDEDLEKISYYQKVKKVYDQLNKGYIKENGITLNNVTKYIDIENSDPDINVIDMLELVVKDNQVIRFALRAKTLNSQGNEIYLNFIVYMDYLNLIYAIEPIDNDIIDLTEVNLNRDIDEVPKNENNKYTYEVVVD